MKSVELKIYKDKYRWVGHNNSVDAIIDTFVYHMVTANLVFMIGPITRLQVKDNIFEAVKKSAKSLLTIW
jgi:hypothetical protein